MHHGEETTIPNTSGKRTVGSNDGSVSPDGSRERSQSPGEAGERPTRPSDAPLAVEQIAVTRELENIVATFRERKCGQSEAFSKIVRILDGRDELSGDQKDQIISIFSSEITSVQAEFDRSAQQGRSATGASDRERAR